MVAIISIIFFILSIQDVINYSKIIKAAYEGINNPSVNSLDNKTIVLSILSADIWVFNFLVSLMIMIISIFNIVGFIFKKYEFNFISIGLYVIMICMSIYVFDIVGISLLILITILNIFGYICQHKINYKY